MKNILLINDNRYFLEGLSLTLSMYLTGCTILTAESINKMLGIMEALQVDLLVTDLDMPFMEGYDLLMAAGKKYAGMPVFITASNCDPEMEKRLLSLGASRCIEKPFGFKELADMIKAEFVVASPAA